jgi:hypothetical protein
MSSMLMEKRHNHGHRYSGDEVSVTLKHLVQATDVQYIYNSQLILSLLTLQDGYINKYIRMLMGRY